MKRKRTYITRAHGFNFYEGTPAQVARIIDELRTSRERVIITLGDLKTGKPWNEEHDVEGYIGKSSGGTHPIPLLVYNNRSLGGGALMTDRILRIRRSRGLRVLYQAANYQAPEIEVADNPDGTKSVSINGEIYAPHCSSGTAKHLIRIMA